MYFSWILDIRAPSIPEITRDAGRDRRFGKFPVCKVMRMEGISTATVHKVKSSSLLAASHTKYTSELEISNQTRLVRTRQFEKTNL